MVWYVEFMGLQRFPYGLTTGQQDRCVIAMNIVRSVPLAFLTAVSKGTPIMLETRSDIEAFRAEDRTFSVGVV
jgi:hypothetical protein